MSDPVLDRTKVTFAQAEGREALPSQLSSGQLSVGLRVALWNGLYRSWENSISFVRQIHPRRYYFISPWSGILEDFWSEKLDGFIDEFDNGLSFWVSALKPVISERDYVQIFDLLQFVIRHHDCPSDFLDVLGQVLERGQAAYRVVESTILPITSIEDAMVVNMAFKAVNEMGLDGAKAHLMSAGQSLTLGEWANSARESIHSIESALKVIEPTQGTLSSALLRLEKSGKINPNLKRAMNALYDYTSDEDGIRHAKVLSDANVGEAEAIYLFGVCASFLSFIRLKYWQQD